MKWYQRDTNNRYDPKMIDLFARYRSEGRDLYWTVLDMIAEKLGGRHYNFCLEETTHHLSNALLIPIERVDAILNYCVELGLFDRDPGNGLIRCLKIMSRLDDTTSRLPQIKMLIQHAKLFEASAKTLRPPTYLLTYQQTDLPGVGNSPTLRPSNPFPSIDEIWEKAKKDKMA